MTDQITTSVRITPSTADDAARLARALRRSRASVLAEAVEVGLEAMIQRAIARGDMPSEEIG